MLRFLLFILLFSPSLLFGQKSTYRAKIKDALFFWDDKLQKFVIIDDSVSIHVYNDATKNWDSERIALMDTLLMRMAITELIHFSSIPIKVTMNEYIEISKEFSTPKSNSFINGILDKILADLKASGKVQKEGRGLLE